MEFYILKETINNNWPMLVIFLSVLILIRITSINVNHEKFVFHKEFFSLLFVVYALLLFNLLTDAELNTGGGVNLVPFTEILRYKFGSKLFYTNVVGNIVIFLPFGYFVSRYVHASKVNHIFTMSILTSFIVEFVQHYIGRSFDIDDIILNVLGSCTGFILYIAITAVLKHLPRFFRSDTFYNLVSIVILIMVIVYMSRIIGLGWF